MRIIISALLSLLFAGPALAQESCRSDVGGTWKSGQGEIASESNLLCSNCREINHHLGDYRNTMWNWAALGRGPNLLEPASAIGIGRYVFDRKHQQHRCDRDAAQGIHRRQTRPRLASLLLAQPQAPLDQVRAHYASRRCRSSCSRRASSSRRAASCSAMIGTGQAGMPAIAR